MREAVPTVMASTLTHAMMLMALVDFFALKYLHAKVRYISVFLQQLLTAVFFFFVYFLKYLFHFKNIVERIIYVKYQLGHGTKLVLYPCYQFFLDFPAALFYLFHGGVRVFYLKQAQVNPCLIKIGRNFYG